MTQPTPDRFEKSLLLMATRERVWKAIIDSVEFGAWFGCAFDGPFVAGKLANGRIVMPKHPQYDGLPLQLWITELQPQTRFSFQWHPYAIERGVDYSHEPTTLVVFTLEDAPEGILLRVTESGFSRLPLLRQAKAFEMNSGGWASQLKNIAAHVGSDSS